MDAEQHLTQEDIVYLGALLQQTKSKNVINAYAKILIDARKSGVKDKPQQILHNNEVQATTTMTTFSMAGSSLLAEGFISMDNIPQQQRDYFLLNNDQKQAAVFGMVAIKERVFTQQQINQILAKWSKEYDTTKCNIADFAVNNKYIEPFQVQTLFQKANSVSENLGKVSFRDKILQVTGSVPNTFGRYKIEHEIARGGMGIVYKAYDPSFERTIALKVLISKENASQLDVARFKREALSVHKIQHPHIIPVYDLGHEEGIPYFCMAYIDGNGLDKEPTPMHYKKAIKHLIPIAEALHSAHQQGIIHRDIKPANIMVDKEGKTWLTDFGLAKDVEGVQELTKAGSFMGTPAYMAPEQIDHPEAVDQKCDIYSLGIVFYLLLTGKTPYDANTFPALLRKIAEGKAKAPHLVCQDVPVEVSNICMRAIAKKKKDRYSSAQRMSKDLESQLHSPRASRTMSVRSSKIKHKKRKKQNNNTLIITIICSSLFVIFIMLLFSSSSSNQETNDSDNDSTKEEFSLNNDSKKNQPIEKEPVLSKEDKDKPNKEDKNLTIQLVDNKEIETSKMKIYEANNKIDKASTLIEQKNYSLADIELDAVLAHYPNHARANYQKSILLTRYGDEAGALEYINKAISVDSHAAPLLSHKGGILRQLNRFEEAADSYSLAISIFDCSHCRMERGQIYLHHLKSFTKAIEDFEFVLNREKEKEKEQLYELINYAYSKANDPQGAVKYFSSFIDKNPQIPYAYVQRGFVFVEALGQNENAKKDFLHAIELDQNYYEAYEKLAYTYLKENKHSKAVEYLNQSIEINSSNYRAYAMRGDCFENKQEIANAVSDWKKAVDLLKTVKFSSPDQKKQIEYSLIHKIEKYK